MKKMCVCLKAACAAVLSVSCAFGATQTWVGNGGDANWSTAENWDSAAPVGGDALVFEGNKNLGPVNDLAAGTSFGGITFGAGAGAFSLSGNGLVLEGNLLNNAAKAQRVALPLAVSGTRTFNTAEGPVVVDGALSYSGSMILVKQGADELVFTGESQMPLNTANGRIQHLNGTLRFAENSVFAMGINNNTRDIFVSGNAVGQNATVVVERGAAVTLGGFNIQTVGLAGNTFDMLIDGGSLDMIGTDNSFGDQGGSLMSISLVNGGILTAAGDFNAGTRSPLAIAVDGGSSFTVQNLCMGRGLGGGGDRNNGATVIDIIEGSATVNGTWELDSAGNGSVRTNVVTVGDGRVGKATFSVGTMQRTNPTAKNFLNINGGEVTFRANMAVADILQGIAIGEGGAFINVAGGASVTLTAPIAPMPDATDGGITKRGTGTLVLNNGANRFDGDLRIEGGAVRIPMQMPQQMGGIFVAEGATLSLRGSQQQTLEPAYVTIGGPSAETVIELDVDADGTNPDTIHFPQMTTIGRLNIRLVERNAVLQENPVTVAGDYVLFTYASEPPDVSLWRHGNPAGGMESEFIVDRVNKRIILRLTGTTTPPTPSYEWANPLGGNWGIGGNWQGGSVPPDSPFTWCRLWDVLSAPSAVTLASPVSINGFSVRGANAYTVTGAGPLTLAGMAGVNTPSLLADTGAHTVAVPVALTQASEFGATDAAARLDIAGEVSGTGPLRITRSGTVSLTATNTFTGGLALQSGTLEVAEAEALGAGLVTFSGGTMKALDSMTVPNTWAVSEASTLNIPSGETVALGDLSAFANVTLTLPGEGTLELYGAADINNNVAFRPRQGAIRVMSGADYFFRTNNRDNFIMEGATAATPVGLEIQPGATLMTGMRTLQGKATILVDGGALLLPNTEAQFADNANGTVDLRVTNGGLIRQEGTQANFNLGVHGVVKAVIDGGSTLSASRIVLVGNAGGIGARPGSCEVNVSGGGTFEARDTFGWLTTSTDGLTADLNILTGGTAILPASVRNSQSKGIATLTLDGGTLICSGLPTINFGGDMSNGTLANYLYGVNVFLIGEDGGAIDTRHNALTITQPLALAPGALATDGLTKLGSGSLTLAGGITCPMPVDVTVAEGLLALGGAPTLSDLTVAGGAAIAVENTWAVSGTLTLAPNAGIRWDGLHDAGTYTLATFSTFSGNATTVRILNTLPGYTYVVATAGSALTLTIGAPANDVQWENDTDGSWNTATEWTPNMVPNGIGHVARFADIFTEPRMIAMNTSATLSGLMFDAAFAPVLQLGSPLAFQPTQGSLPGIRVTKGAPIIGTQVNLPGETAVAVAQGASLTLAHEVIGTGPLNLSGQGTLVMAGTNLSTTVNVTDGVIALGGESRQDAPVLLNRATLATLENLQGATPITVGAGGATIAVADNTVFGFAGPVTGSGVLTKTGDATLALPALPGVDMALGKGTLAVTSALPQVWAQSLRTGADTGITVLRHAGDIELAGPVSGGARFIKTGPGTLSYTYPGAMTLAANVPAATENTLFNIGPNGEAPTTGPYTYNILDGTVVMGVPGQSITIPSNMLVGGNTTDAPNAETEGHLVINDGAVRVDGTLHIARGNGSTTTAPASLSSSVTLNNGTLSVGGTINLGAFAGLSAATFTATPKLTVNDGLLTAQRLLIPEVASCTATATINGGEVRLSNDLMVGSTSAGTGHIIITDGLLYVANNINLGNAAGSTGTLHIAGGIVDVNNVVANTAEQTQTRILFDGGVFRGRAGPMAQPKEAQVLAGGMIIEILTGGYSLGVPFTDPGLSMDAGLTKRGPGYMGVNQPLLFKGPAVIEEGELRINVIDALPATTTLIMRPGTTFQGRNAGGQGLTAYAFTELTLGATAADPVTVKLYASNTGSDCFDIAGTATLGAVAFEVYAAGTATPTPFNGTFTLITYSGPAPDVSGLSVANELDNHTYVFNAANGEVTLTIGDRPSTDADIVWIAADDDWNTAQNWQSGTVPLATTKVANFPWQADPVTVTVDTPASIGGLLFGGNYTLDGTDTLTLDAPQPVIMGASTIRAPLAIANAAEVSVQPPNGGRLTVGAVTGANAALSLDTAGYLRAEGGTVEAAVNLHSGTLELSDDADITGDVQMFAGSIAAPGDGTISGAVGLQFGQRQFNPSAGSTLKLAGPVFGQGELQVTGAGRVELAAPNTYSGKTTVQNGTLAFRAPATAGGGDITLIGGRTLATAGTGPVTLANDIIITNGNATLHMDAPLFAMGNLSIVPANTARTITKTGPDEFAFGGQFHYLNTGTSAARIYIPDGIMRFLPGSSFTFIGANAKETPDKTDDGIRFQVLANTVAGSTSGITIEQDADVQLSSLAVRQGANIWPHNSDFRLLMNGGTLTLHASVPLCLGDQSGTRIHVEFNDGLLYGLEDNSCTDLGTRSPVYWEQNGGTSTLGRVAFGRTTGADAGRTNGCVQLVINDGLWEARTGFSWKSTGDANATNSVTVGCGEHLQGIFSIPPAIRPQSGGTVILNMNGGILRTLPVFTCGTLDAIGSPANFLGNIDQWNVGPGGAAV
ncbi:MAG: autotransporter-associated beta strand repeat-containing protein, partial [Kiritimatiellaeota bacterium]|nr:autotransporter-associated beta strand repeat-containing protein [Kiritimatiellota bacterium]